MRQRNPESRLISCTMLLTARQDNIIYEVGHYDNCKHAPRSIQADLGWRTNATDRLHRKISYQDTKNTRS